MRKKEIEFIVDAQGRIRSTVRGVKGSACAGIAEQLRDLGDFVGEERTGEYYESKTGIRVNVGNRGRT